MAVPPAGISPGPARLPLRCLAPHHDEGAGGPLPSSFPVPFLTARRALCVTALGLGLATSASAQSAIEWSGLSYLDYSVLLASDDGAAEGHTAFDYRRIYLTADADLGGAFAARVRLEATGRSTTAQGRPAPFVKDAWLQWRFSEAGHRATLGVQPPPLFEVSEDVWGYRSLDGTLLDRTGAGDSRDHGLRLDGPLAAGGGLRYAAMVGNGNGVGPEAAGDPGKHVYGQLVYAPDGPLRATLGADYEADAPLDAVRQSRARVSAFVGAVGERARGGAEAFYLRTDADGTLLDRAGVGASVFGAVALSARTALVARYDYLEGGAGRIGADEHYVLAALAYRPAPPVRLMPNVIVTRLAGADPTVLGRVTVEARF